jgi:hypothetical protein
MAEHKIYRSIIEAIQMDKLNEQFTSHDFRSACPGIAERTYNVFLNKHRVGNPSENSELLIKVSPGKFKLLRPFKYGF